MFVKVYCYFLLFLVPYKYGFVLILSKFGCPISVSSKCFRPRSCFKSKRCFINSNFKGLFHLIGFDP